MSMPSKKTIARPEDLFEKELLWAWLDSAQIGMCLLNSSGMVLSANAILAEQFSIPQESLYGASLAELCKRINADAEFTRWAVTPDEDGKRSHVFERNHQHVDLAVQATTLRYHNGERFRILAITDETLLKRAQLIAELDRSNQQWETLNAGVVISDALQPDMPIIYVNAMFEAMFARPRDLQDPKVIAEVLKAASFDAAQIMALAADPAMKQALIANTEQAVAKGVFGAPTFFVGEKMFWGQDRMDAVAEALAA